MSRDRCPQALAEAVPELEHVPVFDQTLLYGPVIDEAHLYGLLARFHRLGLHVLEMRQLPDWPRPPGRHLTT